MGSVDGVGSAVGISRAVASGFSSHSAVTLAASNGFLTRTQVHEDRERDEGSEDDENAGQAADQMRECPQQMAPTTAADGKVINQAAAIRPATPQRTLGALAPDAGTEDRSGGDVGGREGGVRGGST